MNVMHILPLLSPQLYGKFAWMIIQVIFYQVLSPHEFLNPAEFVLLALVFFTEASWYINVCKNMVCQAHFD